MSSGEKVKTKIILTAKVAKNARGGIEERKQKAKDRKEKANTNNVK